LGLFAREGENVLSWLIEATKMFTGNPHRLVIIQALEQKLVDDAGDGAILRLCDPGQPLIEIDRDFNTLAIFTRWHPSSPSLLSYCGKYGGIFSIEKIPPYLPHVKN
jgi:hypothetical protein